ncbi:MAG: PBECR4 domain-containing protein [Fusobacterium sp.]
MEHKFLNSFKKISLSQVDFKEYFEFYRDFVCPYFYKYTFEDNTEIEISFAEENFSHLLGLQYFKTINKNKKAKEINEDILKEKINLKNIMILEPKTFTLELKDRLTYFPVLRTLLENVDTALKYDLNVIWNSKIEFSFLLKTDKISILVYLAVKEIKNNKKICVPVSLLVDRNDRFSKMNLERLKVVERKITKK